ncbi:hypothetical protein ACLOJK_027153 [Asimina triloba]
MAALPPEPTRPSPPPLMNPATASRPRVVTVCQLRRRPSVLSASPDLASRNRSAHEPTAVRTPLHRQAKTQIVSSDATDPASSTMPNHKQAARPCPSNCSHPPPALRQCRHVRPSRSMMPTTAAHVAIDSMETCQPLGRNG